MRKSLRSERRGDSVKTVDSPAHALPLRRAAGHLRAVVVVEAVNVVVLLVRARAVHLEGAPLVIDPTRASPLAWHGFLGIVQALLPQFLLHLRFEGGCFPASKLNVSNVLKIYVFRCVQMRVSLHELWIFAKSSR